MRDYNMGLITFRVKRNGKEIRKFFSDMTIDEMKMALKDINNKELIALHSLLHDEIINFLYQYSSLKNKKAAYSKPILSAKCKEEDFERFGIDKNEENAIYKIECIKYSLMFRNYCDGIYKVVNQYRKDFEKTLEV